MARQHDVAGIHSDLVGHAYRVGTGRDLDRRTRDADEQARIAVRAPAVFTRLRGAMEYRHTGVARRTRQPGAVVDQIYVGRGLAQLYYHRGTAYYDKGEYDRAIADFDQALRLQPKSAATYNYRGLAKLAFGDDQGAMRDFDEAIRADSTFSPAYYNRGAQRATVRDFGGAIADMTKLISLNPDYVDAYLGRANLRGSAKDTSGAMEDYSKALTLAPNSAEAFQGRGALFLSRILGFYGN